MSKGWKEVARLGVAGARYPHILVDAHGWCLRMGARPRTDEKYYSNLQDLFQGLLEHSVRRRLMEVKPWVDLRGFVNDVRAGFRLALQLGWKTAQKMRSEALGCPGKAPKTRARSPRPLRLLPAIQEGVQESTSGKGRDLSLSHESFS